MFASTAPSGRASLLIFCRVSGVVFRRLANWGTYPMRKFVILAGLLAGAALSSGTPVKAWVGCECVKLGAAPVCVPGVLECAGIGGVCLAPCDYVAPKPTVKHCRHHHAKKMKMKTKEEEKKM